MKKIITIAIILFGFSHVSNAQDWTVSTNAIMWADFGSLNVDVSRTFAQHFSAHIGGRYNPWYFKRGTQDQFQNRKRGAWVGLRYWPWYANSGWFIQAKAQWQEYNYYLPGLTPVKEEGDRFGGVLGGGWAMMVNKHFNIEFGLGVFAGTTIYNEDLLPEKGRRITQHAQKFFVLPDELSVNFVFVF